MRVDLHLHTRYSPDSLTPLRDIIYWVQRRALDAIAVTDHNTIAGALELQRVAPFPVIIGEEIMTTEGEIIGLFLQKQVPAGLAPLETVERIHAQGGLVYVPHPCDSLRRSTLSAKALSEIRFAVDLIEVLNARVTRVAENEAARTLATEYDIPWGAGSDAHQGFEIGRAHVCLPEFSDAASFLRGLRQGRVSGSVSSPLVHVGSMYAKMAKGFLALSNPQPGS